MKDSQRYIFLDTETTGLDPSEHRIIEIACIEMIGRQKTNNAFHTYLNPERTIDAGAQAVHGINLEDLQDKPKFSDIANEFLAFIENSVLVIHNASFDLGFLDAELGRLFSKGKTTKDYVTNIIDTLKKAKQLSPRPSKLNLDYLCRHFGIDNSKREKHGAAVDATLLCEVYLAMTRGQEGFVIEERASARIKQNISHIKDIRTNPLLKVIQANSEESSEHQRYLQNIKAPSW